MLRKYSLYLVYIALFALLGGCTGGTPSEADARQEFEKKSNWSYQIQHGMAKVLSFKKVNGQSGETFGVKFYMMDYQAQLEFLKNTPRRIGCLEVMEGDCGGHKVGNKITVSGQIGFGKTEKGWQGQSGTVY